MARLATVALLLLSVCATATAVTPALRGQVKAECPADMLHELVTKCPNLMENPMMKTMMTKMKPEQLVTMINNYLGNRKTRLAVLSYLETYCAAEIPGFCTMCHLNDCPHSLQEQEDNVHKFQLEGVAKQGGRKGKGQGKGGAAGACPGGAATSKRGDTLSMEYTGWLYDPATKTAGKQFDSNVGKKQSFVFQLGAGRVIQGWDQGLEGLCAGVKKTLIIPPELGYGERGAGGGVIPPGATLKFDVKLLKIAA